MKLLFWGVLATVGLAFTQEASATMVVSCNNCSETSYKTKAIAAAGVTSQPVYVIDNKLKVVKKYRVTINNEPGSYYAHAIELPAEQDIKDFGSNIWAALAEAKDGYIADAPSVTNYLRNTQINGTIRNNIRDTFFNGANSLRFELNNGVLAAFSLDQPAQMMLEFADHSRITVSISFALEFSGQTSFNVKVGAITELPLTAQLWDQQASRWVIVPTSRAQFNGYEYFTREPSIMSQLETMAGHYGIPITRETLTGTGGRAMACGKINGEFICTVKHY